jgi:hypothetical protein
MDSNSVKEATVAIADKAQRADQKARLLAWGDICEKLVELKAELSIASAVRQMTNNGYKITKRTVYNKGDDNKVNDYRKIFDLWVELKSINKPKITTNVNTPGDDGIKGFLGIDLRSIQDSVTRYQVSLMLGQLKSYKSQLDLLNQVRSEMSALPDENSSTLDINSQSFSIGNEKSLTDYDIQILKEFMENKDFDFDENGKMTASTSLRKGTSITSEGFKQALEKVVGNV